MARFVKILQTLSLLLARIGLGAILLLHGANRWEQGAQRQVDYLTQFGTPYPQVAAWGAIAFEVVGGAALVLGALTPLIGLGVLVQQILTIAYTNWYRSPNLLHLDGSYAGGYEYNVALGLLGLLFVVFGGGAVSVDRLFRRKRTTYEGGDVPPSSTATRRQPAGV